MVPYPFDLSIGFRIRRSTPVTQQNTQPDERVEQHQGVRDNEYPILHKPAVDGKAYRRGHLSNEEPLRHALARFFPPLLVNLFANGQYENHRTGPSDHFSNW
jgi:hypothetical protein